MIGNVLCNILGLYVVLENDRVLAECQSYSVIK